MSSFAVDRRRGSAQRAQHRRRGRYGGDEFIVLLADTDVAGAVNRRRKTASGHRVVMAVGLCRSSRRARLPPSALVTYPDDGATIEALIQNADARCTRQSETARTRSSATHRTERIATQVHPRRCADGEPLDGQAATAARRSGPTAPAAIVSGSSTPASEMPRSRTARTGRATMPYRPTGERAQARLPIEPAVRPIPAWTRLRRRHGSVGQHHDTAPASPRS